MKKIIKFIFNATILSLVLITCLWFVIARPIDYAAGSYKPDYVVSPIRLAEHTRILSEELIPRNSANPANLMKTAKYIKAVFSESSKNVSLKKYKVNSKNYANVIALYGPESSDTIIIGAHYDAYSTFPGADDNASGVAGLLELGKLLKTLKLNSRVELIAYTFEEPPNFATDNMGSAVHAKNAHDNNKKIKIMISLEMIGYFNDEAGSQQYPVKLLSLFYPEQGNFIAVIDQVFSNHAQGVKSAINRHTDLAAYSINAPTFIPGIDFSDHRNYWKYDYPAVMVTDTSFYRNFNYHTADDSYKRLNYKKMAKVVYGIFKYIVELDSTL